MALDGDFKQRGRKLEAASIAAIVHGMHLMHEVDLHWDHVPQVTAPPIAHSIIFLFTTKQLASVLRRGMIFASFLKGVALIVLLTLNVTASTPDDGRRLRIEPLVDHTEHPPARELQVKSAIVKAFKWMGTKSEMI
ncbi:hypothetical protein L917_10103 [Phytophthora nicotianae]|uniref:Uncharacterized protein n=2 Tax=Phytophthora nicotianae TaxID=4792 RepID=V9EZW4_PHYNI|nr:hypothetical protein F443_10507 [Phytophthora nicotianae P1569]ETL91339.1 hypothetical protein L917_10103 [Phytophthora nicotianae]